MELHNPPLTNNISQDLIIIKISETFLSNYSMNSLFKTKNYNVHHE